MKRNAPTNLGPEISRGTGANNPSIPILHKNVKNWIECAAFAVMTLGWRAGLLVVLVAVEVSHAIQ